MNKINETYLRNIIKESLIRMLNEWDDWDDDDEWDDWDDDDKILDCESFAEFVFNPYTFEILSYQKDENLINKGNIYIEYFSNDFPYARGYEDPGDYWNPPSFEGDCGECGGNYEYYDHDIIDNIDFDEVEKIEEFEKIHKKDIIDELSKNAYFV